MNYGTRSYRFEIASRRRIDDEIWDKRDCDQLYDGRNCELLVEICGTRDPRSHMIMDLGILDADINKILENFDHKTIDYSFSVLATKLWTAIRLNYGLVRRIRLYENKNVWHDVGDNNFMDITRTYTFDAAHRTNNDDLIVEENVELYGKCNTLHGHEYDLSVSVRGTLDPLHGTVIDKSFMDETVEKVLEPLRNRVLNEVIRENATTENFIRFLWEELVDQFDNDTSRLYRLRLRETARNYFDYYGDQS